jgi:hypothetical protein
VRQPDLPGDDVKELLELQRRRLIEARELLLDASVLIRASASSVGRATLLALRTQADRIDEFLDKVAADSL